MVPGDKGAGSARSQPKLLRRDAELFDYSTTLLDGQAALALLNVAQVLLGDPEHACDLHLALPVCQPPCTYHGTSVTCRGRILIAG
jgi:hypothetical protein